MLVGCADQSAENPESSPWFEDVAGESGIDFTHISGAVGEFLLPEIMGGGIALFDVENDGDLDAYFVQSGGNFKSHERAPNELYLNDGNGNFQIAKNSGLEDVSYGIGVTTGDFNNDGFTDVYVTNVGSNSLFRNNGDGSFQDVTDQAGVAGHGFSTAAAFGDVDRDGDLDLFVVQYVDWKLALERNCYDFGTGARNYCDPQNYDSPSRDVLFRNNGDGTFDDVSIEAGIAKSKGNGLGLVATDLDGDDDLDFFVANDKTPNHMWLNQGGFRFENQAFQLGTAMDDHGIAKAGMGVIAKDVDQDSDMDIVVVNIQGETNSYFRNEGAYFTDATAQVGLTRFSRNYTRFGIAMFDFNLDGRLDLYEANGRVNLELAAANEDLYAEPNALFQGSIDPPFVFVDIDSVHTKNLVHTSRGLAAGDINGDGRIDLFVVNRDAPAYVLSNLSQSKGNWINVALLNPAGSPALHAELQVESNLGTHYGQVQVGGSYLAANSPAIHMTFPTVPEFSAARVKWSDGTLQDVPAPLLNRRTTYVRHDGL